jgi:DNA primase
MEKTFDIQEVAAKVNIVDVIGMFVQLKRDGGEFRGLCPFHPDRDPSFRVIPSLGPNGRFHCFPCGDKGGDVVDFVRRMKNCDYRQAARFLVGEQVLEFADADRERLKKESPSARSATTRRPRKRAATPMRLGAAARPIAGSPVEAYLRGRGHHRRAARLLALRAGAVLR